MEEVFFIVFIRGNNLKVLQLLKIDFSGGDDVLRFGFLFSQYTMKLIIRISQLPVRPFRRVFFLADSQLSGYHFPIFSWISSRSFSHLGCRPSRHYVWPANRRQETPNIELPFNSMSKLFAEKQSQILSTFPSQDRITNESPQCGPFCCLKSKAFPFNCAQSLL